MSESDAPKRTIIPNPNSDDPNAGILVVEGDPLPASDEPAFDIDAATGKELDARFGELEGYPHSAKVAERRAFVRDQLG